MTITPVGKQRNDLRRLKWKGLILKPPRKQRYQLTALGRRIAVLVTKSYMRVLAPGLTGLDPGLPDNIRCRSPLATAWRNFEGALDQFIERGLLAA